MYCENVWTIEVQRGKYLQEWLNVRIVQNFKYTWIIYNKNYEKLPLMSLLLQPPSTPEMIIQQF